MKGRGLPRRIASGQLPRLYRLRIAPQATLRRSRFGFDFFEFQVVRAVLPTPRCQPNQRLPMTSSRHACNTRRMNQNGTINDIKAVVSWLERSDEDGWLDNTELADEAVRDLRRMAAPKIRPDKTGSLSRTFQAPDPDDIQMQHALPHAEAMLRAMRRHDRKTALSNGQFAVKELPEVTA